MTKDSLIVDFYDALLCGNGSLCEEIIDRLLISNVDYKLVYRDFFQKALYRVGKLLEQGKLTFADEHLAANLLRRLLEKTFLRIPKPPNISKKVVLACTDNEHHALGLVMVSHVFSANGWDAYFLGACTPAQDVINAMIRFEPDIIGISSNLPVNFLSVIETIDDIKSVYINQQILVGGQGIQGMKSKLIERYEKIFVFESILDVDEFLKRNYRNANRA